MVMAIRYLSQTDTDYLYPIPTSPEVIRGTSLQSLPTLTGPFENREQPVLLDSAALFVRADCVNLTVGKRRKVRFS